MSISNLEQRAGSDNLPISEESTITEHSVIFEAIVESSTGENTILEVEYTSTGEFADATNIASDPTQSGTTAVIEINLPDGDYRWRARTRSTVTQSKSEWMEFGAPDVLDFKIRGPFTDREVVNINAINAFRKSTSGGDFILSSNITLKTIKENIGHFNNPLTPIMAYITTPDFEVIASTTVSGVPRGSFADVSMSWNNVRLPAYTPMKFFYQPLRGDIKNSSSLATAEFIGERKEPVIFVPGMMGSRLVRASDGEEAWPDGDEMKRFPNGNDEYLDQLKLDSSGEQILGNEIITGSVIQSELGATFYGNLRQSLLSQGFVEGESYFEVPYDWRLDLQDEKSRLASAVVEAFSKSPTGKVNIVAHSMGGLLVKEYLAGLTDTSFVDKVVLVGVPQLGAPKAFKALQYGDNMGFEFGSIDILNPDRVKSISQNMPGVYELLPSRKYVQINGGYVQDFQNGGVNILDYDETNTFMTSTPGDARNTNLLADADAFHIARDNEAINAPEVYNIAGCRTATIAGFKIYDDEVVDIETKTGDGTVPLTSAMNLASNYTSYFVSSGFLDEIDHLDLVGDPRPLSLIQNIISGNSITTLPDNISTSTSACFAPTITQRLMRIFSTHSPVALHIYDSQNRHTGPTINGDIELGIPESRYETIGENSFVFVPDGDTYRVVADALDSGSFTLKAKSFDGESIVDAVSYVSVPLASASTTAELLFEDASQADLGLKVDDNGDGTFDEVIQPLGILSGDVANDVTPPEIAFNMPAEVVIGATTTINFLITDDLSGIALVSATFDGVPVENGDIITIGDIGDHILRVEAKDKAGNPRVAEHTISGIYDFSGFLPPIKADGSGVYKQGRTLPVKFQLTDANGDFILTAVATLTIAQFSEDITGTEEIPLSVSSTDTGNQFRYDKQTDQYIYNLSTDTMTPGTWRLFVDLDDGERYEVDISIK